MALSVAYFFGCCFIYMTNSLDDSYQDSISVNDSHQDTDNRNWYRVNQIYDKTVFDSFFTVMYFMMTLLSSVGYGDLVPVNKSEMVFIVCEQWIGIFLFSYIMGQLMEIIINMKNSLGIENKSALLEQWIGTLKKFKKEDDSDELPFSL